ncbi:MAG: prephenate dehydrogenase [Candidatus Aureabacteria bacterium]|nr:prephenate dehydrogenase [Candidatus Auribacterota bacterium]
MKMHSIDKLCIIGLGLIGGSIGLAARERRIARKVYGLVRRQSSIEEARRGKVVEVATMDPEEAVQDSDLVIIATPISSMERIATSIKPYLTCGTIVSDVASSKKQVVRKLEKIFHPGIRFVGAHPIAGSERQGMQAARAALFEGAPCILTPTHGTDKDAQKKIVKFWTALGCRVSIRSPREHDRIVAAISHLPHFLSASLVNAAVKALKGEKMVLDYAGSGFRDTTRVAASDAEMWVDIGMDNADEILHAIGVLEEQLAVLEKALKRGNRPAVRSLLSRARTIRRKFNSTPADG